MLRGDTVIKFSQALRLEDITHSLEDARQVRRWDVQQAIHRERWVHWLWKPRWRPLIAPLAFRLPSMQHLVSAGIAPNTCSARTHALLPRWRA
jgi:hypothetical protein